MIPNRFAPVILAPVTALTLFLLTGCEPTPAAGRHCSNPNDVYAHNNTRLVCGWDKEWHK